MTADGSSVALHPGFRDLGDVVAHTMELQGGALPTLEQTAELLRGALSVVRERDQRSNDVIVDYIRNCTDWTSRTREGLNNIHYYIGTVMPRPDGGLTYIELDHSMPGKLKTDKNMSVRDVLINQALDGQSEVEVSDEDINAYIIAKAEYATVRQLSPRAVQLLREYAVEGTSDFEIASLQYRAREVVEVITTIRGEEVPVCGLKPSWMDDVLSDEITHGTVYLQGSVPPQNVDKLIGAAQVYARDAVVEQQTAAEEYRQLIRRYEYDDLTDEQRAVMAQRMQEIMVLNGAPAGAHFLEWYYVIPRALNERIPDTATIPLVEWGEGVHKALIEHLRGTGLYLYDRGVSARLMAMAAIATQLTSAPAEPKAIGEFS